MVLEYNKNETDLSGQEPSGLIFRRVQVQDKARRIELTDSGFPLVKLVLLSRCVCAHTLTRRGRKARGNTNKEESLLRLERAGFSSQIELFRKASAAGHKHSRLAALAAAFNTKEKNAAWVDKLAARY